MTNVLGQAIALAADIHKDDLYGDGPYVFHLLQVLKTVQEQGEGLTVQVLAILHDSLEDHPEAAGRIERFLWGMTAQHADDYAKVLGSLRALSRHFFGQENYNEFLDRVIQDRDATVVKLADLQRNSAPKEGRSEKHIKLALERYIPAMAKVTKALLAFDRADAVVTAY